MADADGRGELAIAPGQLYIEVEYDYEYKAKNRLVTIREGECYMLVRKTNEDWWQVRKDEGSKPFYVPAQYVREVRKALMPPPKPLIPGGSGKLRPKPNFLDVRRPDEDTSNQSLESERNQDDSNTSPTRADSPPLQSPAPGIWVTPEADSGGSSEKLRNDSESGEELSGSSLEHLQIAPPAGQVRAESPVYANLQDVKSSLPPQPSGAPLHVLGDWETYKDAAGRHFYCNRATQERTWKPPRARDASLNRGEALTPGDSEWLKHVDGQGRQYYYSADGSRSEWELPKYHLSPLQPGDPHPKTRSLDRREPPTLNKWRHSTCILETNEKPVKNRRFRSERLASSPTFQEQESPTGPKHSPPDSDSCPASPKSPSSPSEKCGVLNVTKITEHGRKVRKNWTSCWTVLHGSSLVFTKGQGGGASWFGGGHSKPEFTVDLRGGSLEWASKDKTSKKHTIELKTRRGTELLIHSESENISDDWYKALAEAISTHAWESDEAIEEDMPESPGPEKQDKEKDHRDSKKNKGMKPSASVDSSDPKKTRVKLKRFLTRRPTLQAVKDKGYIKDQIFGSSLASVCQGENSTVPKFVTMCINHVEKNGLHVDGLYRVSGNLAVIQKLRFAVNHDEKVDLEDSKWEDIHVTTGALKMFFRELPEPLFTFGLFDDFMSAIKRFDKKPQVRDLIRQLPRPNHDTLQALFKHLRKVIDYGSENRMTPQSLAIVFGPTLLRPEVESLNMAVHTVYQNHIVELILLEYDSIFGR